MKRLLLALVGLSCSLNLHAAGTYSFGVLPQRSALLTAQYWNPILAYVSREAGVTLLLKVARTAAESDQAVMEGDYDFVYTNHIFQPRLAEAGYRVILRPRAEAITGQIVTLAGSPIRTVQDLQGKEVGFPSRSALVGYMVPMDHLVRAGIQVTPVFGGNQEGIMGQLKAGKVPAAAVNGQVMRAYAKREGLAYRVLWESPPYSNLPIAAHPRVAEAVVGAVRKAFIDMPHAAEGAKVLAASAAVIEEKPPLGFQAGSQRDYQTSLDFYKHTVLQNVE